MRASPRRGPERARCARACADIWRAQQGTAAQRPAARAPRPQLTIATALVFYHRFYAFKSYEHHERFVLSTTALFLASKVEETPRKLKDVVGEALKNWNKHVKDYRVPEPESREVHELKEKVLVTERILLQTIGFDLSIEHPYRPLLAYVKSITGTRDLAQIAWNFINDSYRTTACLQVRSRTKAPNVGDRPCDRPAPHGDDGADRAHRLPRRSTRRGSWPPRRSPWLPTD